MKFTTLVSPEQLEAHLRDPQWLIFDCRFALTRPESGRQAYVKAHIPGARYAHLEEDLCGPITPASGRHPLPDPNLLADKLGRWGVDGDKQVVVYDDSFGAMAVRLWWLLRWLGHDAVALLDGGFPAWQRQGRELGADTPLIQPAAFRAAPDDNLWIDSPAMLQALEQKRVIIDARAEERFSGFIEPLDKVAGHIPGTLNSPYEDNLDMRGNFLKAEELRALYEPLLGGSPPNEAIHMCGSGVTACHNLLAMEIAGMPGGKLYVGSWSEWITDPSRPIATGANS
ncbi:MAG: sulfurtransferase [Burkholderiales bacterium]|nr:sulfurtransferase [Burkholderiales bacterium]